MLVGPGTELGEGPTAACTRTMLLVATEKLRGDSELKVRAACLCFCVADAGPGGHAADGGGSPARGPAAALGRIARQDHCPHVPGPLRSALPPLQGLFSRSSLLLSPVFQGGEPAWQQNLARVWEACPFLPAALQAAVLEGSAEAALLALRLVLRDSLAARARAAAKPLLGRAADAWPLEAVARAWALAQCAGGEGRDWEAAQPDALPPLSAAQLCEALWASGALSESRRTAGPTGGVGGSLSEALRGTPLEGAVAAEEEAALPADCAEMLVLWAAAKNSQKSKLRSSVIRAAGSDTSWIDRDSKKK